jgi:hypothetical protein
VTDTLTNLGEIELAAVIPGAVAALAIALPDLQARLDALLAFSPGAIDLHANLALAEKIIIDIKAAIALNIVPPSISAQIAIVLGLVAALKAQLAAIAAFKALLTARAFVYAYSGTTAGYGPKITAELAAGFPGTGNALDQATILTIGATAQASVTAMAGVFVGI